MPMRRPVSSKVSRAAHSKGDSPGGHLQLAADRAPIAEVGRLAPENEQMLAGLVFEEDEDADLVGEGGGHGGSGRRGDRCRVARDDVRATLLRRLRLESRLGRAGLAAPRRNGARLVRMRPFSECRVGPCGRTVCARQAARRQAPRQAPRHARGLAPFDSAYSTSMRGKRVELLSNPASAAWSRKAAQRAGFVSNSPYRRWADRGFRPMLRGLTRLAPPRLSTSIRSTYAPRPSGGARLRPSLTNPQMPPRRNGTL